MFKGVLYIVRLISKSFFHILKFWTSAFSTVTNDGGSNNYNFRERLATTKLILGIMDKRIEILEIQT